MGVFKDIEGFISNQWNAVSTFFSIISLEARLAKLSIYPLLISALMFCIVLTGVWLTTLAFLWYGIFWFTDNVWMALGGMLLIQMMVLGLLIHSLRFNVKNMSFERTRRYFNAMSSPEKGASQHELKKAIDNNSHATGSSVPDVSKSGV